MPLSPSNRGCVHKPARKVCTVSRIKVLHVLHTVMSAADAATSAASASAASATASMSGAQLAAGAAEAAATSASSAASASPLDSANDFYSTGRVGRRNALPNILSQQHAHISTADLPDQLMAMSTRDRSCEPAADDGAVAGSSSADGAVAGSSSSEAGSSQS